MLSNVRIVLIGTTHPGNIGAAARAMKTMGLEQLALVAPEKFPHPQADAMSAGAEDVLARARVHADLPAALEGCSLVLGLSARRRSLAWPELDPRAAARRIVEESVRAPVAVLFGREHSGLSNEELDRCHFLVNIPSNPAYSSLNLAAAVQVMAYEIRLAALSAGAARAEEEAAGAAGAEEMERFFEHLEQVLVEIRFLDPDHPKKLMRRLRRLFNRARPDQAEVNILRGILTEVRRSLGKL